MASLHAMRGVAALAVLILHMYERLPHLPIPFETALFPSCS